MNSKASQETPKISSFPFSCFPLFLCIDHLGTFSYLSLLFFETLHSDGYICPFLFFLSLLFFSQLFVKPPQTTISPFFFAFLYLGDGFDHDLLNNVRNLSIVLQALCLIRSNPLNLFVTFMVRDLIQVILEWSSGFPYFLQFKSEFGNKRSS